LTFWQLIHGSHFPKDKLHPTRRNECYEQLTTNLWPRDSFIIYLWNYYTFDGNNCKSVTWRGGCWFCLWFNVLWIKTMARVRAGYGIMYNDTAALWARWYMLMSSLDDTAIQSTDSNRGGSGICNMTWQNMPFCPHYAIA
jgi:hypothetical protein